MLMIMKNIINKYMVIFLIDFINNMDNMKNINIYN